MTIAKKPKLYAQRDCAIDGKHFASGEEAKGVSAEELANSLRLGFVGPTPPGEPTPAPEVDSPLKDEQGNG